MPRINGSIVPPRARTLDDAFSAKTPTAKATQPAAKVTGFAGVSNFLGGAFNGLPSKAGGPHGTAPSGARKLSPNDLGVLAQDQGNTNACGTTSLANVLTHWGQPTTHEQVDKDIRHFDMFTAPDRLVDYARDHGMRAELKADASVDDIARMVDQGVPPIVLMDPDSGSNASLHYVTVSGYNRDASGNISELVIADSAGGDRYTMPIEEFQKKWDNLELGGIGTGLNNVMISVVPNDGRKITGGDGVTRSASEIKLPKSSFWSSIKSSLARGVANLLSDVTSFAGKAWNGIKNVWNGVKNAAGAVWDGVKNAGQAIGNAAKSAWDTVTGWLGF
ncbi:C39 family peptidase [Hyalangium gracile]|uniref:C39 family peptidase n=1 Tax=Hyalangium gracile TaxID=394092 RepID=UPI001CCA4EFC|nr:C39 family peptidase [Hyalangium gracile]